MEGVLFDKWQSLGLSRNSWSFMKSSDSLRWAQDSATIRYPESVESSTHLCVLFPKIHFNILSLSLPLSPCMSLHFRIPPKICLLYLYSPSVLHVPPISYILLTRIIFGDHYTEWSISLFYFFRHPVIFLAYIQICSLAHCCWKLSIYIFAVG
jgi:hypothetical protein